MAYEVNKTNGDLVVNLLEGEIDNTTTSLALLGKNYLGYGELIAENFIHLLENFSNPVQPGNPVTGQLWFNTIENRLTVRDAAENWKPLAQLISKISKPTETPRLGDFWYDSANKALKIYTADVTLPGSDGGYVNVGSFFGGTGISFAQVRDTNTPQQTHTVLRINVENVCVAVISSAPDFTLAAATPIAGFADIGKGINLNSTGNDSNSTNPSAFKLRGISMEAEFADVAEIYVGDATYEPGTLVALGGAAEVTQTTDYADSNVFGIVSSRPAYLLNARKKNEKHAIPIAVAGRLPVKVIGEVVRGDRLVASKIPGVAQAAAIDSPAWSIIARSLGYHSGDVVGKVEATVGVR